ncbi:MAG: response regulator, partial [Planctomycetes bacterium]|nr:response regulator [Planctomycetota bacterium]
MDDKRAVVMIVDDSIANLRTAKNALGGALDVFTLPSAAKLFNLLKHHKPDLILLDVLMPEMDGFDTMKILKSHSDTSDIPVIFLTGKDDQKSEIEGLSIGAVDYISKPFLPQLLSKRVDLHLSVQRQRRNLEEQATKLRVQGDELKRFNENLQEIVEEKTASVLALQDAILGTVVDLVESRDDITGGHVWRTQKGLRALIDGLDRMGVYQEQMRQWNIALLLQSSQLHDVGKIAISDSILNKPGRLTAEEFEEMKKHVPLGVKIVERIEGETPNRDFLEYAKIFVATHHEKWDGSGYPNRIAGKNIPLIGRLMAVADV